MMTTTTPATMIYKGFKISFNDPAEKTRHMKTVDDYETDQLSIIMHVDAARIALSHTTACRLLRPMSADQANFLKRITIGCHVGSLASALAPNRIEARHFTKSSRVRNLVHGGTLGALVMKLLDEPNRERRSHKRSRTFHSVHILRRVNGQSGCEHVRWSIPEFQCRYNIGIGNFKNKKGQFEHMSIDDTLAQLTAMNTAETRQKFMDECKAVANHANRSRVKCTSVVHEDEFTKCDRQLSLSNANDWIAVYIHAFTKVCSNKMSKVVDPSLNMIDRAKNVVELYRFMSSSIDWILMDCNLRFVCGLDRLWPKHIDRIIYMSQEGIEHSACMLSRYFPEMMTPELHVLVKPSRMLYRVPGMHIADDDALFGPLKRACQGLLPDAIVSTPNDHAPRRAFYDDDDDFSDDDDEYSDDEYDNRQG